MELKQASDRIWYSTFEEERDRPSLGYIRGDHFSIAVDAGHSDAHVDEFYALLEKEDLPLPALTVITHWHWDHAFGMHRINGLSVANSRTDRQLRAFSEMISHEGAQVFLDLDPSIRKEYKGNRPVRIVPADIVFEEEMRLDAGGVCAVLSTCVSPHTEDTTLIYVPEEKFLFVGDSISGEFPTWERDPEKTRQLIGTLEKTDADWCLGGHWYLLEKEELINALKEDAL